MKIKNCSVCGKQPEIEIRRYSRTMTDSTIVNHYSFWCRECENKYLYIEGTHFRSFEWHTEQEAIDDWNSIVDNNNSFYTKEYQLKHPLQIKLV